MTGAYTKRENADTETGVEKRWYEETLGEYGHQQDKEKGLI